MDSIQLALVITVTFTSIATALNCSEPEPLQRILYPFWVLGMCLPIF